MTAQNESWMEALDRWVKATSLRKVGKALNLSPATISLCLRNLYPANPDTVRIRVEQLLLGREIPPEFIRPDPPQLSHQIPQTLRLESFAAGSSRGAEALIQKELARRERGQIEVPCLAGFVDFLTATEVVEIKNWRGWKEAIKVLIYAEYFPGRSPRIHLFDNRHITVEARTMIQSHYDRLGIRLTWHDPFITS